MKKVVDSTGRIFYPHTSWEDANEGMYNVGLYCPYKFSKSIHVLTDQELFWDLMCQMRIDWKHCFEFNVSNRTQNRRAWLGQASCFYNHGAEFNITILAWGLFSEKQQKEANSTAQKMIELFEKEEMKIAEKIFRKERSSLCPRTYCMDI